MMPVVALSGLLLAAPDPLVAEVVAGHRANFERIRTMRAVYSFRSELGGPKPVLELTDFVYLRDPNGVLVRDGTEGRKLIQHAHMDGEVRRLLSVWPTQTRGAGPSTSASRLRPEGSLPEFNLWLMMGAAFNGGDRRPHDLRTVVAESDPPATATRATRDGVPLIRLTRHARSSKGEPYRVDGWHDPARGHVLVHSEWTGMGAGTGDWTDLRSTTDGVWFPIRHVQRVGLPEGELRAELTVTDLAIKQPLAAGATVLALPAGTVVKDELRGTEYKGNPDWTPAGPEKKWQKLVIPAATEPGSYTGPTRAEPAGWTRWLLYAAAGVLAAGLAGLVVRWVLARRRESA